jgi:hypothetical protein
MNYTTGAVLGVSTTALLGSTGYELYSYWLAGLLLSILFITLAISFYINRARDMHV